MRTDRDIRAAIESLCEDICTHYEASENKVRAEAIAILTACLRLLPEPEPEPEPEPGAEEVNDE